MEVSEKKFSFFFSFCTRQMSAQIIMALAIKDAMLGSVENIDENVSPRVETFRASKKKVLDLLRKQPTALLLDQLGQGGTGLAYEICTPYVCSNKKCHCEDTAVHLAVKIVVSDENKSKFETGNPFNEVIIMTLANQLVLHGICPNLPLFFLWSKCDNCLRWDDKKDRLVLDYENGTDDGLLMINELAYSDLSHWLKSQCEIDRHTLLAILFQIIAGLYAMQKYYDIYHVDLNLGNVLVHKLPHRNGVYHYSINDVDYYVPHSGWLFVLWDFGASDRILSHELGGDFEEDTDVLRLVSNDDDDWMSNVWDCLDNDASLLLDEFRNAVQTRPSGTNVYTNLFKTMFSSFQKRSSKAFVQSSWDMDKILPQEVDDVLSAIDFERRQVPIN